MLSCVRVKGSICAAWDVAGLYDSADAGCACRTKAFLLPRNPTITPAEALKVLAKLEGEVKANEAYV